MLLSNTMKSDIFCLLLICFPSLSFLPPSLRPFFLYCFLYLSPVLQAGKQCVITCSSYTSRGQP